MPSAELAGSESRPYLTLSIVLFVACLAGRVLVGQAPVAPGRSPERVAFDAWLDAKAMSALDARRAAITTLTTRAAVEARQRDVRAAIAGGLGLLPASDAPLNATITRTTPSTSLGGYRIEHLWFESLPGLRVTANAYVPDGPGPFPAVIGTAGHADEGKASPTYQNAWVSLARRGFLVLAYDPVGQGERLEYLDPVKGGSRVGIGTREHSMTGQQLVLTGRTIGAYMVQDMRRALDYLETRPDVDRRRIAVAGNSGGGTQAALLGAVDPRLAAIVVSCYMTSWRDMWTTPGPQDAEQILPGFVANGLDFADFAIAAAPRGFLVSSAIQDYFPIAGSRAVSAELAPIYVTLGAADKLARVENDATHGWTQPLREGAYRALGAWLDRPGADAPEATVAPVAEAALRVTTSGQLATSGGTRTVRAINADEARTLATSRAAVSDSAVRSLIGLGSQPVEVRVILRSGNPWSPAGESLLLEVEPGVRLKARLRRPAGASPAATLLLDERGATTQEAVIERLVAQGQTVLALDVRGTGALAPAAGASGYSGAYQFAARAWLLGTSVVAWQAQDALHGLAALRAVVPGLSRRTLHATGQTVPAALLASQVDRPDALVLEDGIVSYLDLATADTHDRATLAVIPGVLRVTDLPELMSRLAPAAVRLVRPRGAEGIALAAGQVATRFAVPVPPNVIIEP